MRREKINVAESEGGGERSEGGADGRGLLASAARLCFMQAQSLRTSQEGAVLLEQRS